MPDDWTPPRDERAEHALVALAALAPVYRDRVLAAVHPDDCYALAWRECLRALAAGQPMPREHVRRAYSTDADPRRIADYAERVRDCARRRRAVWIANEIAADACRLSRPWDPRDAAERVRRVLVGRGERALDAAVIEL